MTKRWMLDLIFCADQLRDVNDVPQECQDKIKALGIDPTNYVLTPVGLINVAEKYAEILYNELNPF